MDRIETSLTPTQAVVLWMGEAHRFPSVAAYVDSLVDGPDTAWPLHRLAELIEPATLEAVKGRPRKAKHWAVKQALRDVAFLFFVHQEANGIIEQEWRAMHLGVNLLAAGWREALPAGDGESKGDHCRSEVWRHRAKAILVDLHKHRETVDLLSRTYFAGHPLLFRDADDGLAFCIEAAETLVEAHNDEIEFSSRVRPPAERDNLLLDVESLKRRVQESAGELVEDIAVLTRGEALELVGESEQARMVVKRHHQARSTAGDS